jgi:hypothetical protein
MNSQSDPYCEVHIKDIHNISQLLGKTVCKNIFYIEIFVLMIHYQYIGSYC